MARRAAARLPKPAEHRIARPVDFDDRHQLLDPRGADELGLDALQRIGMGGAGIAAHFRLRLGKHQHAARAEHHVVVQILTEPLIKRARLFIDRRRGVLKVIRADDRGVAPGIATAKPALFDHRHIGDAEIAPEIIGRGQPMPARANDHHIIARLGCGRAPGPSPPLMIARRFARDGKG